MSAHVNHAGKQTQSSASGSSTIYTAPANNVKAEVVVVGGGPLFVGWFDSAGNTLHGNATLVKRDSSAGFGPMTSGDILVAVAYGTDVTFVVGEIY